MGDDVLSILVCGGGVCTICFGMWWGSLYYLFEI